MKRNYDCHNYQSSMTSRDVSCDLANCSLKHKVGMILDIFFIIPCSICDLFVRFLNGFSFLFIFVHQNFVLMVPTLSWRDLEKVLRNAILVSPPGVMQILIFMQFSVRAYLDQNQE